jgi:hypothetical protein
MPRAPYRFAQPWWRAAATARLPDWTICVCVKTIPCRRRILLPGARQSQEVKCLALGHAFRSVPHSPMSFSASAGPNPWISVRSTPSTPYSAVLTSKVGVLTCLVFTRGLDSFPTGFAPLLLNAAIRTSSLRSQSSIFAW